jgi:hypothetical protein
MTGIACLKERCSPAALARKINLHASRHQPSAVRNTASASRNGSVFSSISNVAESILKTDADYRNNYDGDKDRKTFPYTVTVHPPLATPDEGWKSRTKMFNGFYHKWPSLSRTSNLNSSLAVRKNLREGVAALPPREGRRFRTSSRSSFLSMLLTWFLMVFSERYSFRDLLVLSPWETQ